MDSKIATPYPAPPPVIEPGHTFETVTERISRIVLGGRHPLPWFIWLFVGFIGANMLMVSVGYLLFTGIGIFGAVGSFPCPLGYRPEIGMVIQTL